MNEDLEYDPESGLVFWKKSGKIAGTKHHDGYIQIKYKGKFYGAHRIAWYLVHGTWPSLIDHINGIKSDNKWNNLREATKRQNAQNSKGLLKGATRAMSGRWKSRIVVDGKELHLGVFDTALEAHEAYKQAAKKYFGEFANDGSVSRYGDNDVEQRQSL